MGVSVAASGHADKVRVEPAGRLCLFLGGANRHGLLCEALVM